MSAGMPELGSKISLISKADIRYEGRLFTVDPQECTIALAGVRSFGTEDRDAKYPINAQNQIYDYILFRGSDIKDIRVVNNVIPNDPAIMQMSMQPNLAPQGFQQPQSYAPSMLGGLPTAAQFGGFGQAVGGNLGPIGGGVVGHQNAGAGMQMPRAGVGGSGPGVIKPPGSADFVIGEGNSGPMPPVGSSVFPSNDQRPGNDNASVLDMIAGGSRSTTPVSSLSRKSPTTEAGVQVNRAQNNVHRGSGLNGQQMFNNQRGDDANRRNAGGNYQRQSSGQNYGGYQQQQRTPGQHQRRDMNRVGQQQNNRGYQPRSGSLNRGQSQRTSQGSWMQGGGRINSRQQMPGNRGIGQRQRSRSGNRGPRQAGGYRGNQAGNNQQKRNQIKFESDYDFEQANTEFEELRSKLVDLKIGGAADTTTIKPEGKSDEGTTSETAAADATAVDPEKKDDSGNETGAGELEEEEYFYDKAKSFFDKISCEAVERQKGRSQRTDWRTERKLNSETFGVASARRGNFRGRQMGGGGYYNRNQMGGYRQGGGYRNNNGGYRNNGGQQQHQQHQQQHQQRNNNRQGNNISTTAVQGTPSSSKTPSSSNTTAVSTTPAAQSNVTDSTAPAKSSAWVASFAQIAAVLSTSKT